MLDGAAQRAARPVLPGATAASEAFADRAAPIGHGQTISQPYMVALMTQRLDVQPDHRVLEIGTGSGYQTAILAQLAGEVYSIERVKPLLDEALERLMELGIRNVHFRHGDGTLGWPEAGAVRPHPHRRRRAGRCRETLLLEPAQGRRRRGAAGRAAGRADARRRPHDTATSSRRPTSAPAGS